MIMAARHDRAGELQVFRLFMGVSGLDVNPGTVVLRGSPEPDIRRSLAGGEIRAFELAEIREDDLARGLGASRRLPGALLAALDWLEIASRFSDAYIGVSFRADIGAAEKHRVQSYISHDPVDLMADFGIQPILPNFLWEPQSRELPAKRLDSSPFDGIRGLDAMAPSLLLTLGKKV